MRSLVVFVVVFAFLSAAVSCVGDSEQTNTNGGDSGDATTDAALPDAIGDVPTNDAGADAIANTDAGDDADAGPVTVYADMTNAANWVAYDVTQADATLGGYDGTAAVGQYVYFAPYTQNGGTTWNGVIGRYDTKGTGFGQAASWTPFNMAQYNTAATGFNGVLYDGTRYLYLFPYRNPGYGGLWARVDTQGNLGDTSAYKFFDLAANVDANAVGFSYGAFDGRYIYFAPYLNAVAVRYDTQATFDVAASYKTVDLTAVANAHPGVSAMSTDGHFIYYSLYGVGTGTATQILRYDLSKPFDQTTSFTSFDVKAAGVSTVASGFVGSCFDGKYVYFTCAANPTILRFDTTGAFSSAGAWSAYDTTSVDVKATAFSGSSFDGRYVYFAGLGSATSALVVRFDSTGSFGSTSAWQSFDVSSLSGASSARSFGGMSFDGQYIYLGALPKIAARFNAKTPASIPARPLGSFY